MNVADGSVISAAHRRYRATECEECLAEIDHTVSEYLDIRVVRDNCATHTHPAVTAWPDQHPRFQLHVTPTYSSWINQVKRLVA